MNFGVDTIRRLFSAFWKVYHKLDFSDFLSNWGLDKLEQLFYNKNVINHCGIKKRGKKQFAPDIKIPLSPHNLYFNNHIITFTQFPIPASAFVPYSFQNEYLPNTTISAVLTEIPPPILVFLENIFVTIGIIFLQR